MKPSTGSIESATDEQAQVGPQWVDKFGRVRTPRAYYQLDDGRQVAGPEAVAVFDRAFTVSHAMPVRTAPRPRGAGRPAHRQASQRSSARSGDSGGDGDPPQPAVDALLRGLRLLAKEYGLERVYELIPGSEGEPDRWKARCPVHPSASAYTLLITELPEGRADVWCRVGCDPGSIVRILVPDPEREQRAAAHAEVLLWAQSYGKRRVA